MPDWRKTVIFSIILFIFEIYITTIEFTEFSFIFALGFFVFIFGSMHFFTLKEVDEALKNKNTIFPFLLIVCELLPVLIYAYQINKIAAAGILVYPLSCFFIYIMELFRLIR